jgi:hypothetical protein
MTGAAPRATGKIARDAIHEGGCLCGAVRYEITGAPKHVSHCHCSRCRRAAGAPVVTWAYLPVDRLRITRGAFKVYHSSHGVERRFCDHCGSALFYWSSRTPDMIDVAVATLDLPEDFPPDHHNFAGERIAWLHVDPELPTYEGFTPGA